MLWLKAFHIILVTSWFAGLFYLPRIFVNLAMVPSTDEHRAERERLLVMAGKLLRFMTPLAVLAIASGLWLWLIYGIGMGMGWIHAKTLVVVLIAGYHLFCKYRLDAFRQGRDRYSHVWYRWFNEIPVLLLIAAVLLVVVKPF